MTPLKSGKDPVEKYYIKENQLFLEPGDTRVQDYAVAVVDEIVQRYPGLDGIHLDYIRYPNAVPYLPDSRFNTHGISYGYGERNVQDFLRATGIDPVKINGDRHKSLSWDNWKRERVTNLVEKIAGHVKEKHPRLLISCAVIPSPERAYSIAFQDWPLWLEKGVVDFVVLMNYTVDTRLALETARSAIAHRGCGKVYIGLGLFLLKENPATFSKQYKGIAELNPDGIVLFSYDDVTEEIITAL